MAFDETDSEVFNPMMARIESIIATVVKTEVKRLDERLVLGFTQLHDEMKSEQVRVNEQMELRARHQTEMAAAETKRIDANRDGDMRAVALANDRAITAADVLRQAAATQADTLRGLVATTAQAASDAWGQVVGQITTRLTSLETARYESRGAGMGIKDALGWAFGAIMTVVAVGTLFLRRHP